jgi:hypothetical protein
VIICLDSCWLKPVSRAKQLSMCDPLTFNHTIFSKESGEIALPLLASP